jgi:hypothetical protein
MAIFNSHVSLPEGISPKVAIVIGKIVGENEDQPSCVPNSPTNPSLVKTIQNS